MMVQAVFTINQTTTVAPAHVILNMIQDGAHDGITLLHKWALNQFQGDVDSELNNGVFCEIASVAQPFFQAQR